MSRHSIIAFLLGVSWVFSPAQQPENLSFRISSKSKVVMADLIVTDKDNHYITDLKPSEVEVLDNGKPQAITYFQFVQVGAATPEALPGPGQVPAATPLPSGAGNRARFAAPAESLHVAVVLDFNNMPVNGFNAVKEALLDFVKTHLSPQDRVMVVGIGTRVEVLQEFTSDRYELTAALERIQPRAVGAEAQASLTQFLDRLDSIAGPLNPRQDFIPEEVILNEGSTFLVSLEQRLAFVAGGLNAVSRNLAALPGRKHIVFFSAGYPLNAPQMVGEAIKEFMARNDSSKFSGSDSSMRIEGELWSTQREHFSTYFQSVIDRANRAQVAFYTIDVRGLIARGPAGDASTRSSASQLRKGTYQKYVDRDINAPQDFIYGVAAGTGGAYFLNTNDMQKAVKRACLDARQYYLLAFQPSVSGKLGQYHKLEVRVSRPGVSVSARRGYYELDDAQLAQQDLLNAITFPSLFHQFPLAIEESTSAGTLMVSATIPTAVVEFTADGEKRKGSIEIFGALLDKDGKLLGQKWLFAKTYMLNLGESELANFRQRENMVSKQQGKVAPGEYTLAVVARQTTTGKITVVTKKVTITP